MTTPADDPRAEAQPDVLNGGVIFHNPDTQTVLHGADEQVVHSAGDPMLRADATDDQDETDDADELAADHEAGKPEGEGEPVAWEWVENGQGGWSPRAIY